MVNRKIRKKYHLGFINLINKRLTTALAKKYGLN